MKEVQEKLLPGELGVSAGAYDHTPLHESPKVGDPPQEEWGTYRAESESPDCE